MGALAWVFATALIAVASTALGQDASAPPMAAGPAPTPPSLPVIGSANLPRDLSPWSMFMSADILVQTVMVGLAFASLVTWTVWLAKNIELWAAMRTLRRALAAISGERSLAEAYARVAPGRGIVPALIDAAVLELRLSSDLADKSGIKERIATRLARLEAAAGRSMNRGTGVLATIGATAPFVGLLGTVWGIMNSFIGISKAQTTNLAVVAPGIAEALLATLRRHPCRHHLQSVHPLDCPLPGPGGRRLGGGASPRVARSRPRSRPRRGRQGGGVSHGGAHRRR
jgi:biopolymer transport protein ExbB